MGKAKKLRPKNKLSRKGLMILGGVAAVLAIIIYAGINSTIPANGTYPVLSPPRNNFIKATHSSQSGYYFLSQSSGAVKGSRGGSSALNNPTYELSKGELESIHVINEDQETHSKHNLNIDAFNVHTRDLGYFESQTITFIADKTGTFEYYCSLHPEMKGQIIVK